MTAILCSTGALFPPGRADLDVITAVGARLGVDGLELLVTSSLAERLDEVAESLATSSAPFPAIHARKSLGSNLPSDAAVAHLEETLRFAQTIGASVVVLHLWNLPESDADLPGRLEAIRVACDVADGHDVTVAVETVPCLRSTPLRNLEAVLEHEPRATCALDTEFLAHHGELEEALDSDWLWADDRVRHVHVKDYAGGLLDGEGVRRYLHPGEGTIDFVHLFDALHHRRYPGAVSLEAPAYLASGLPDVDGLRRSIGRMRHTPWRFEDRP